MTGLPFSLSRFFLRNPYFNEMEMLCKVRDILTILNAVSN